MKLGRQDLRRSVYAINTIDDCMFRRELPPVETRGPCSVNS